MTPYVLSIILLRKNQNQPNFFLSKFDKYEKGGKVKISNCVGKKRVKVEESVENCLKMNYFQIFPKMFIPEGNFRSKNM